MAASEKSPSPGRLCAPQSLGLGPVRPSGTSHQDRRGGHLNNTPVHTCLHICGTLRSPFPLRTFCQVPTCSAGSGTKEVPAPPSGTQGQSVRVLSWRVASCVLPSLSPAVMVRLLSSVILRKEQLKLKICSPGISVTSQHRTGTQSYPRSGVRISCLLPAYVF